MRFSGERPVAGTMPDSLLGLHAAGYREVAARLGPGRLLDVGCGLGDGTALLAGEGRSLIGVDYEEAIAALASRIHPQLLTACTDGARLGLRAGALDWVSSSHLIEHFENPELHVAELARVLAPGGTAFVVTPNRPADFENPFHISLLVRPELEALLGRHFGEVWVVGLDGGARVKEDFERRRRLARRLLALDVFDLRHRLPRRWHVGLHGLARRVAYRWRRAGAGPPIDADDFFLTDRVDDDTLVLFATARLPRRAGPGR